MPGSIPAFGMALSNARPLALPPAGLVGLVLVVFLVLAAALAPLYSPYDPLTIDPAQRLLPPSAAHWLGTDDLGRDVFSRVVAGGRTSLTIGVAVSGLATGIGALLGLLSGYVRSLDGPITRLLEGIMAFPGIMLAIAAIAALGPGLASVIVSLSLVYIPVAGRLMRGLTLQLNASPFVEGARAIGVHAPVILGRYIAGNAASALVVQWTATVAAAILAEAALSYLGAGIDPEAPTWGGMLRDGQRLLGRAWWLVIAPGGALFLTVLAFNLLGDALRDVFDPNLR